MEPYYYKLLQVPQKASSAEIREGYKSEALRWHPDRVPSDKRDEATARFKSISEAYKVLRDPSSRSRYDHQCSIGKEMPDLFAGMCSPDDMFREVFGEQFSAGIERVADVAAQFFDNLAEGCSSSQLVTDTLNSGLDAMTKESADRLKTAEHDELQCKSELTKAKQEQEKEQAAQIVVQKERLRVGSWILAVATVWLAASWGWTSSWEWGACGWVVGLLPVGCVAWWELKQRSAEGYMLAAHQHAVHARNVKWRDSNNKLKRARSDWESAQLQSGSVRSRGASIDAVAQVGMHFASKLIGSLWGGTASKSASNNANHSSRPNGLL